MSLMKKSKYVKAFTLAEVLITLGVIGVVAAMTIPVLMNNIQDAQLKTAWKKEYSVFNSAQQRIMGENGSTMLSYAAGTGTYPDNSRNAFLNYISYIKKCDYQQALGNCWHQTGVVTYLDGTKDASTETDGVWDWAHTAGAILKDGTYVIFSTTDENCTWTSNGATHNICSAITVDVNGAKPPNVIGKDVYEMYITVNSVKPYGAGQTDTNLRSHCNKSLASTFNFDCSAMYLYQ